MTDQSLDCEISEYRELQQLLHTLPIGFLITRFITPSLLFPIGSLASPQPTFIAKR